MSGEGWGVFGGFFGIGGFFVVFILFVRWCSEKGRRFMATETLDVTLIGEKD